MSVYAIIKFVHVLLAIIAVGFNASYGIWLARAAREEKHLGYVLSGIKILDDRFANPAYGFLLVTGLAMVWLGNIPLTTFWIAAALVLWLLAVVLGLAIYTPTLRDQILVLNEKGAASADYQRLSQRGMILGIVLAAIVIVIVFLMVTRPG
jgi:uncharacterized membrane protein